MMKIMMMIIMTLSMMIIMIKLIGALSGVGNTYDDHDHDNVNVNGSKIGGDDYHHCSGEW